MSAPAYIDYQFYTHDFGGQLISSDDFVKVLPSACRAVDAMLFHGISNGLVSEASSEQDWEAVQIATAMQVEFAVKMGADAFLASDGRAVAAESGGVGGISDSVTYADGSSSSGAAGLDYRASRSAFSFLASKGLIARMRIAEVRR